MFNFRHISMVLISGIVLCGLSQGTTSAETVGLWDFNEKAVGSSADVGDPIVDDSTYGSDGAVVGDALTYIDGSVANSIGLDFPGNGYVSVPAASHLAFSGSFTVEAIVRGAGGGILSNYENTTSAHQQYWLRSVAGTVQAIAYGGGTGYFDLNSSTNVTDGNWHHIAMVYDDTPGSEIGKLYIDYVLEASQAGDVDGTSGGDDGELLIGRMAEPGGSAYGFSGDISLVRLSNVALDSVDFAREAPIPEPNSLTLLGWGLVGLLAYARRRRQ